MPTVDAQPSLELQPSASYSLTIRTELSGRPGTLGRVTSWKVNMLVTFVLE